MTKQPKKTLVGDLVNGIPVHLPYNGTTDTLVTPSGDAITVGLKPTGLAFQNAADRNAHAFVVSDIGKTYKQESDATLWLLLNNSPVTWQFLGSAEQAFAFVFQDESARLNATVADNDIGKISRQLDNNSLWILTTIMPTPTWTHIGDGCNANTLQGLSPADLVTQDALGNTVATLKNGKLEDSQLPETALTSAQLAQPNGIATLSVNGKLNISQIPSLNIAETFVINSEAEMLTLSAQSGDIAVRVDENSTYILQDDDPSILQHWIKLLNATSLHATDIAGLGDAALLNVGLDAGTVAAGDHTHNQYEPADTNIQAHLADTNNPHGITVETIGASPELHTHKSSDVSGLGDAALLNVGIDAGTVAAGDHTHSDYEPANINIQAHIVDTNNPHGITAESIGASPDTHTHTSSDITDLNLALIPHTHTTSDITDLEQRLEDLSMQIFYDLAN